MEGKDSDLVTEEVAGFWWLSHVTCLMLRVVVKSLNILGSTVKAM